MKTKRVVVVSLAVVAVAVFSFIFPGCQPRSNAPVEIGAVLPMTGDAAKYGKWIQQGLQMAVDGVNARGGVNGRPLALNIQDCQTSPSSGVSAFLHLLAVGKPAAVLTTLTGVARALIPLAESNHIILFANATLPGLTDGHNYVFRNVSSLASDVPAMVQYADTALSKPKIAILWRNDEFGVWGSGEFAKLYAQKSGSVAASLSYEANTDDFH